MPQPHIVSDPNVPFGKPVISGTRANAELIRKELQAGLSVDDLLREYPNLTRDQIDAVLAQPPVPSSVEDDDERPRRGMFTDLSGTTAPPGFRLPPEPPLPPARLRFR